MANRHRKALRPQEPTDYQTELQYEFLPEGFVRANIQEPERRPIIMANDTGIKTLLKVKCWYMDGTFKVVRKPFKQLFTVHGFIKTSEGAIKQIPLMFVLMMTKKSKDYKAVLQTIMEMTGECRVRKVLLQPC